MENLYAPVLQVRTKCAIYYQLWQGGRSLNKSHDNIYAIRAKAYSGDITDGSRKRMKRAINLLLQASPERIIDNPVTNTKHPFTVNFITLTVSDVKVRDHAEVMRTCLSKFLDWMRKRGGTLYIWKAELQKRGQIHYHITTNVFIHYQAIRKEWNKLQKAAGYLDSYAAKFKHFDPNSTDVHAVKNVRDLEAYLVKYMVKQASAKEQDLGSKALFEAGFHYVAESTVDIINGKVWDCCAALNKPLFSVIPDWDTHELIDAAMKDASNVVFLDHCAVIKIPGDQLLGLSQFLDYHSFISSL